MGYGTVYKCCAILRPQMVHCESKSKIDLPFSFSAGVPSLHLHYCFSLHPENAFEATLTVPTYHDSILISD